MIEGKLINLRLMCESDLDTYYALNESLKNRGLYAPTDPITFHPFNHLKQRFQEYGLWDPENRNSLLLITDKSDRIVGKVVWLPERRGAYELNEIGWIIFSPTDRGKGYTTEAVRIVVPWLFDGLKINRIEAYIHPENIASQRVAEKCGFTHEATLRGYWYQHGKYQDIRLYRILREELSGAGSPSL